jgi:hypothetical protein
MCLFTNFDIKNIIKSLYQYRFRFIEAKSNMIIYKDGKFRFISLYRDLNNKYWNKNAYIKCWCEVDLNNENINIYKTEPLLNDDETIDDIFCGYDDNRIDLLINNDDIIDNCDLNDEMINIISINNNNNLCIINFSISKK